MARITTEDCTGKIPNHFDLTLVAARRARQLENGNTPLVDDIRSNRPTVTALRDIAAGKPIKPPCGLYRCNITTDTV